MNKSLALVGLALLLVGLLALLLSGVVREVVVIPLLYLLWLMRVLIDSLPQAILWAGFLALAVLVAWKSMPGPPAAQPLPEAAPASRTAVATWASLFERAANDASTRWLLAQRLGQLAVELLASQDERAAQGAWQYLRDESSDILPEVRAYLQAGTQSYRSAPPRWRRWWPWDARLEPWGDPLDLDPEEVVHYLEERLNRTIGAQR